jgi:glycosyltransferase involved in cell wall biosynthesis
MGVPEPGWLEARHGRRKILERAVAACDDVVVLSRHAAKVFEATLGRSPRVIAPGVDLRAFQPGSERTVAPTIICPAAPDEPRKNVPLLIEAFNLVRRRYGDARLILSRPRSTSALRGIPLDVPGVEWLDLDDRTTLARAYAKAWLAVLPSEGEAFGLVLVEALACGTPVVGYADAGIPEIIDRPQIGRLFEQLTPSGLATALVETLPLAGAAETPGACRARAEAFSTDHCTEQYLALYHRLLGCSVAPRPAPDARQAAAV